MLARPGAAHSRAARDAVVDLEREAKLPGTHDPGSGVVVLFEDCQQQPGLRAARIAASQTTRDVSMRAKNSLRRNLTASDSDPRCGGALPAALRRWVEGVCLSVEDPEAGENVPGVPLCLLRERELWEVRNGLVLLPVDARCIVRSSTQRGARSSGIGLQGGALARACLRYARNTALLSMSVLKMPGLERVSMSRKDSCGAAAPLLAASPLPPSSAVPPPSTSTSAALGSPPVAVAGLSLLAGAACVASPDTLLVLDGACRRGLSHGRSTGRRLAGDSDLLAGSVVEVLIWPAATSASAIVSRRGDHLTRKLAWTHPCSVDRRGRMQSGRPRRNRTWMR